MGSQESLDYLFTPSNEETTGFSPEYPVRDVYRNVNNLFYVDETGHYTYDSNWERALLDPNCQSGEDGGGCDFTITQGQDPNPANQTKANRPQFLPLGSPFPKVGDEFTDPDKFFLGMHMQVKDFSIPANGKVLNPSGDLQDMVFKFSGDDDVWVFIDGVLVGDVGGLHLEEDLTINFVTGEVTVDCHGDFASCGQPVRTTIRQAFADARADMKDFTPDPSNPNKVQYNENTFLSGTYHTLDFFYLERGASESNLAIQYNLVSSYDFTSHKSLHLLDDDDAVLQPDQFKYKLTAYNCVDRQTNAPSTATPPMPHQPSSIQTGVTWEFRNENGNQVVICGNSSDGFVNFGSTSKGAGYDYSSYLPLKCKYSYEELPPENAHKIEGTNNYEWNGQVIEPNHDGTYTFGDMAYDLTKYYFWGTVDADAYGWISKEYHLKEDMSDDPLDMNFVNYDNYYGASGRYTPEATKLVEDHDDTNEERTFTYTLRYAGDPATADPVLTGTVTLHDEDTTPAAIDFGDGIYMTLKTLKYLSSAEGGNKAVCTKNSYDRTVCVINYVLTEEDPTRTYNDIKPNTQRFNLALTATDEGNGSLSFAAVMTNENNQTVQNARAPFVNVERENTRVTVSGHKDLLGRDMTDDDIWTYTLSPINGGPMPLPTSQDEDPGEVTNTGQNFTFGNIIFTPDHLGPCSMTAGVYTCEEKIYHYDVTEAPDYPGIANDPVNPKRFNVRVYLNTDGNVAAAVTYDQSDTQTLDQFLTFTNVYQATGSIQPEGKKQVVDTDGNFREPRIVTFILKDQSDPAYVAEERRTITVHDSSASDPDPEDFFFSTIRYSLDTDGELVINGTQTNIPGTPVPNTNQRTWTQTYLITEQDPALTDNGLKPNHQGFRMTVTITDDGEGNLNTTKTICEYDTTSTDTTPACTAVSSIAFVNTERKDITVTIPGTKIVPGHTLGPDDKWYFHIAPDPDRSPAGAPLPVNTTVQNDRDGNYSFGPITFTPQDLGAQGAEKTYYYLVTESGNVPNYSNATGEKGYSIKLSVIEDRTDPNYGELQATLSAPALEPFINFYYAEGSTVLAARKTMNIGIPWPAGTPEFEFKLTGTNAPAIDMINTRMDGTDGVLTSRATQANPTARFAAFTFTHDDYLAMEDLKAASPTDPDAGTYQFTVEETIPTGATGNVYNGVTYNTDKYKVWVSLGYNETQGNVTVTVTRQKTDADGQPIGRRETITASDGIVYTTGDFENEYNVNDVSWTPKASKEVIDVNRIDKERTFTFDLNYAVGDAPALVESKTITVRDSDVLTELNVIFSEITYTRKEGTLPAGTYNLTDLVGDGHAMRETAADGSLVWTIPYVLTEQASGYKDIRPNTQSFNVVVRVTDNGRGTLTRVISPDEDNFASLAFKNDEIDNVKVPVTGTKYIPQRALKEGDKWTFVIWSTNGGPLPAESYACSQNVMDEIRAVYANSDTYGGSSHTIGEMRCVQNNLGIFSFGDITFEPNHLPDSGSTSKTYRYYVAETGTVADVSNTTNPPVSFDVTVGTDASGNLTAVPNPANLISKLTFTNNYYGPGTVVLGARKVMTDDLWPLRTPALTFDFLLTGENPAAREKILTMADSGILTETATQTVPTARFDDFRFTLSDYEKLEKSSDEYYLFRIVENKPTGEGVTAEGGITRYKGVAYSNERYDVRIYLSLDPVTGQVIPRVTDASGSAISQVNGIYTVGTFTNTYFTNDAPISLTAQKKVTEANGTTGQTRDFTFELLYGADGSKAAEDITVSVSDNGTAVSVPFTGTYTRESNPGTGKTSLPGLITSHRASRVEEAGKIRWIIPYILREKAYTGTDMIPNDMSINVTVIVEDDGNGNLTATVTPADLSLEFVNQERKPVQIPVQGKKVLEGRPLESSDVWTFIITTDTNSPLPEPDPSVKVTAGCPSGAVCVKNSGSTFDDVLFGNITFTSADLGPNGGARTHHYRVTETGTVTNVSNSEAVVDFSVTVSVDPTSGDLVAVSDPANLNALIERITFTNHYYDEDQVVFGAEKVMDPWSTKVTEFNFTMTGTNDPAKSKINAMGGTEGVLTAVSRQSAPVARFMPFTFTSEDYNALHADGYTGDQFYTFTITEVVPEGVDANNKLKGVTYSTKTYDVKVTLNMEGGKIIPVVTDLDDQPIEREEGEVIYSFEFVNSYKADPVTWSPVATKRIIDADGKDKDREFTFELSYVTGEDPLLVERTAPVTAHDLGEAVDVIFSQITYTRDNPAPSGQVSLPLLVTEGHHATRFTNAQGQVVYEIPYVLTEVKSEDKAMMPNDQKFEIVVTVIDDGEGKLLLTAAPDNKAYLGFINAERNDVEIPVSGRKYLTGRSLTLNDKWTYILTAETEDAPMPVQPEPKPAGCPTDAVCVQNEYRYYDFGSIVFTPQQLGAGGASKVYTYKVTEIGSIDGVTNDPTAGTGKTFTVTVSINTDNSNLQAVVSPADLTTALTFTNEYKTSGTGEILVQKILEGREWLDSDAFTFTLSAAEATPKPALSEITIRKGDVDHTRSFGQIAYTAAGSYTYILKETKGEIGGVTYDETEHRVTITLVDDGKGHLVAAPGDVLIKTEQFTNTYEPVPVESKVAAQKLLSGRNWTTADEFVFIIEPQGSAPAPAGNAMITIKSTDTDHKKEFGAVTFTKPGTYTYNVTEVRNGISGVSYANPLVQTVTFTVRDNLDGTLGVTCVPENLTAAFTNTYAPAPTEGEILVTKVLEGRQWLEGDTFTFTLTAANDAPVPSGTSVTITNNDEVKTKSFGTIPFTAAGTYTYTVKETKGDIEGITYDETGHTVTIRVRDDGNGSLVADGTPLVRTVEITNTYTPVPVNGEIRVQKVLEGREWLDSDSFTFTISAEEETPMPSQTEIAVTKNDTDHTRSFGEIAFREAGTYTYIVKETKGMIGGVTYDESEHSVTITVTDDGQGNLIAAAGDTLVKTEQFTNTYAPAPITANILAKKDLAGREWTDDDTFIFMIDAQGIAPAPADSTIIEITKADEASAYTRAFGAITFTEAGEFTYKVREINNNISGITYDLGEKTVTITVTDNKDGSLSVSCDPADFTAAFTNTYTAGSGMGEIRVKKVLEGRDWLPGDTFTFTVEAQGNAPEPQEGSITITGDTDGYTASFGSITFTRAGTFSYVVRETKGELSGVTYDEAGHTVTIKVKDDGNGNLVADGTPLVQTVEVTNTYTPAPVNGEIRVQKVLEGREWLDSDTFTFTISAAAGTPMPAETVIRVTKDDTDHTGSFGAIAFTAAGTYTYSVKETKENIGGVTYDETDHTVTLTVADDGEGHLTAAAGDTLVKTEQFTNTYAPAPTEGEILAAKVLEGRDWKDGDEFIFLLTAKDDAPMPTGSPLVTVTDGTAVSFGKISFNAAGNYQYTVTEINNNIPGIQYDGTEHNVTIVVTDNNAGQLTIAEDQQIQTVTITNTYNPAPAEGVIRVQKIFSGRDWQDGDEFTFTLTALTGAPLPAGCTAGAECSVTVTDGSEKAFGSISFADEGTYTYTVKEVKPESALSNVTYDETERTVTFRIVIDSNGNLTVAEGSTLTPDTLKFTNTYTPTPAAGAIRVQKILEGRDWTNDDEFTFTISAADGAPMPSRTSVRITKSDEDQTGSFGDITFTAGGTYTYTVKESAGNIGGITYDESEHTVTITVVDDGQGTLSAPEGESLVRTEQFTNTYAAAGEGEISVTKDLRGREWTGADVFIFTVAAQNGTPMPDGSDTITITSADADFTGSFGTIAFTEAGTYTYTVTEFNNSLGGVTYASPLTQTVTIEVVDDGSGHLVAAEGSDLQAAVTFENTYAAEGEGEILVTKVLEGRDWQDGDSFTFTLAKPQDAGADYPMPSVTTVTITNEDEVKTKSFGTIAFTAEGTYTYTVKESAGNLGGVTYDTSDHTVTITVVDDGRGSFIAGDDSELVQTVEITNTYEAAPAESEIKVRKNLTGRDWKDGDEFTFTLEGLNGAPMPDGSNTVTVTNADADADYTGSFGKIVFSETGTYLYTVTETKGDLSGITYDETVHIVTVAVTDDGSGVLNAPVQTVEITNTFTEPAEGEIRVTKNLVGRDWKNDDEFTFTLQTVNGAPMPESASVTVTNRTEGYAASFGKITFTDPGTYVYIVREAEGDIDGVTYDTSEHTVVIIVENDGSGKLAAASGTTLEPMVTITNTYTVVPACVQFGGCKAFPGAPEDMSLTPFTFTLIDENGEEQTASTAGAGGYSFDPFLYTEPGEYRYMIREVNDEVYGIEYDTNEYTVTVNVTKDESTGKLSAAMTVTDSEGNTVDSSHGLNFTNPYTASAMAYISVTKEIDGADWPEGASVVFTLSDEYGKAVDNVTLTAPGEARFDGIRYDINDVGKTFSYTVTEEPYGFGPGWSVSTVSIPVTVTVSRSADGVIEADVSYDEGATFINSYSDASIQFRGRKFLTGRQLEDGDFRFILEGNDGTYQVVSNYGKRFSFDPIYYSEPGVYEYTIREEIGSEEGMTYDETVYTVTVTVKEEDGKLVVETSGSDVNSLNFTNKYQIVFHRIPHELPGTGFSASHAVELPEMPADLNYEPMSLILEIPSLSVSTEIVGVPVVDGDYPVTWLGDQAGLLEGYSKPGEGRTILAGHNHLNDTEAGPFALLLSLNEDDRIFINDGNGVLRGYSVYANEKISATDWEGLERISSEYEDSITMITCEDERVDGGYANRRIIAARPKFTIGE